MSEEATPTPVEELDDEQPIEAEAPEGLDQEALERRSRALSQVVKFGDPVLQSARLAGDRVRRAAGGRVRANDRL